MIRQASESDLPQLISLWQEAFGDTEEEALFYFQHRHQHQNMLVFEMGSEISGMLSMLPVHLHSPKQIISARYVFAVATKKARRGQGISTRLLEAAHQKMQREGSSASILVPAESSLFEYYGKRGYQTGFQVDQVHLKAGEISSWGAEGRLERCDAANYLAIRDDVYKNSQMFVRWDIDALRFIRHSAMTFGGGMFSISIGKRQAAAVCEARGDFIRVTELACGKEIWQQAMALIHQHFQSAKYQLRMQEGSLTEGSTQPFGMIHWLGEPTQTIGEPPYLAFAKD